MCSGFNSTAFLTYLFCIANQEIDRKSWEDTVWTQEHISQPREGEETKIWPPESCSGRKRKVKGCIKQFFLSQRTVAKSGLLCKAHWAHSYSQLFILSFFCGTK